MERFAALLIVVAILAGGCGPRKAGLVVKHAWDPDYAEYFDDSVDFTMNPDSLSGQWMYSYRLELEGRMSLSDHIVAVDVESVNVQESLDGKFTKQLHCRFKKDIKGKFPSESFVLTVEEDRPGFDSFDGDDARLTDRVFVAFLRLYTTEEDTVGIHWHLSPLSKGLAGAIAEIQKQDKDKKKEDKKEKEEYTLEAE